jgi:zinc D-Ala-D-Ala carboxypeptidase
MSRFDKKIVNELFKKLNTQNFRTDEFFFSQTAEDNGIDNITDDPTILSNLVYTAHQMQKIREILKCPVIINSGYRCLELNRKLGSRDVSQHRSGQAIDFICPDFGDIYDVVKIIKHYQILVDVCIAEEREKAQWIHIAFRKPNRQSFYAYKQKRYTTL